jgi:hypothetical protein
MSYGIQLARSLPGSDILPPQAQFVLDFVNDARAFGDTPWNERKKRWRFYGEQLPDWWLSEIQDRTRDDLRRIKKGTFDLPAQYIRVVVECSRAGISIEPLDPDSEWELSDILPFGLIQIVRQVERDRVAECSLCGSFFIVVDKRKDKDTCQRYHGSNLTSSSSTDRVRRHRASEKRRKDAEAAALTDLKIRLMRAIESAGQRRDTATQTALRTQLETVSDKLERRHRALQLNEQRAARSHVITFIPVNDTVRPSLHSGEFRKRRVTRNSRRTRR